MTIFFDAVPLQNKFPLRKALAELYKFPKVFSNLISLQNKHFDVSKSTVLKIVGHPSSIYTPEKRMKQLVFRLYLPTGWCEATGSEHGRPRCNDDLRGVTKADSLVA